MERRFILFLVLSFAILLGYHALMPQRRPPKQQAPVAAKAPAEKAKPPAGAQSEKPKAAEKPGDGKPAAKPAKAAPVIRAAPEPEPPQQWVTLGSADETDPYRMLVTLTNKGAAVARIELSSPRYCDVDNRSGYLGHLVMSPARHDGGCLVEVVGPGTPAAKAGVKPGDVIKTVDGKTITDQASLEAVLAKTKPKQSVQLVVVRKGQKQEEKLSATLRRRPLEVIKPEGDDPLSMLLSLQQFDGQKLAGEQQTQQQGGEDEQEREEEQDEAKQKEERYNRLLCGELDGVRLRTSNWRLVSSDQTHARFRRRLPEKGLEIAKTYRLAKVPAESLDDGNYPAYHLEFEIEIRNVGGESHKVAYRLDGPNGLPTEGKWYAGKVSRNWGGAGLRDFVISFGGGTPGMIGAPTVGGSKPLSHWPDEPDKPLTFVGVDAQYFSAVLMPLRDNPADVWFEDLRPLRMGPVDPQYTNLTNTSCRLIGTVQEIKPGGVLLNRFRLFTGPKKPPILENDEYRLGELVYFGWPIFAWVAVPLTVILHGFFAVVGNYGLAIILLTVLVRGCMFPLSLKQAAGAQKMQLLQPEIKRIQEKHKGNVEARTKAQQDLFREHNYNPLSGCLPIFIQMPVFIGLYRSLSVAIELRDAPLISHSVRWCSNLAAPDMLYDWHWFMPAFVNNGVGIFGLGPYFNLLPILTIVLFIWQQKMFMPPPADEQAAMQQKIMQYMMIFMGLLFFKVASGLCIYFIASSLWGLAERKFLPKTTPASDNNGGTRAQAKARRRRAGQAKNRRAKKQEM